MPLVNRVRAAVRGLTCETCPARAESVLRERLEPATITIERGRFVELVFHQTASAFPSASFRRAIADAGGEALSVDVEACGAVETAEGQSWLESGSARLLLERAGTVETGVTLCVTGELRDTSSPPRLVVATPGS